MTNKIYYAHTKDGLPESEWQLLKDHLERTTIIARDMGSDAGISDLAYAAALLHDIGKYSDAFQARLRGAKQPVDHATAGAREIMALFPHKPQRDIAELISYCIAGHHTGLPDYGDLGDTEDDPTLIGRRDRKNLKDYSAYKAEIALDTAVLRFRRIKPSQFRYYDAEQQKERVKPYPGFSCSFLTRMLFSALVDADWIETERYMNAGLKPRGEYATIQDLKAEFDRFVQRFAGSEPEINRRRTETLRACLAQAQRTLGFFTLTVPTGGGKTLSSMAFALAHAAANDLKRIIYVIPFTSIIDQNARVFREALGSLGQENVLEHHSNMDWDKLRKNSEDAGDSIAEKLKLASENWDIPIVVTTNVQFFESLFANKKSAARKLHNLAKSVIIFDEVQVLPREFLKPCLLAMSELVQNYGASVVLSTATQPSLPRFFPAETAFTELAPDPAALFDFYRRVQVIDLGRLSDEALLERLAGHDQALCIVNTRRHAKGLFEALRQRHPEGTFHLSTLMCPAHRARTLRTIRRRLKGGLPCRVISTQVMEAGIDVDFPTGYRAMAGLDSIIQAAGRVNREMRREVVEMYVFEPETSLIKKTPIFIAQAATVARRILGEFGDDPTSMAAIEQYYDTLYAQHGEDAFDANRILSYFEQRSAPFDFAFKSAAEHFNMINENTVGVIIPYGAKAKRLIAQLEVAEHPASVLRRLQRYTVNIYEEEFAKLLDEGVLRPIQEHYYALDAAHCETHYRESGLDVPERSRGGAAIYFD